MSTEVAAFLGALFGGVAVVIGQVFVSNKERADRQKLAKMENAKFWGHYF